MSKGEDEDEGEDDDEGVWRQEEGFRRPAQAGEWTDGWICLSDCPHTLTIHSLSSSFPQRSHV